MAFVTKFRRQRKVGLRALRGFGGIRTRADPGTDPRWIGLCTSQGQERPHALSKAQVRLAQAAMAQRDTKVSELCLELGVTKATIYRYVAPDGSLRNRGRQVLAR